MSRIVSAIILSLTAALVPTSALAGGEPAAERVAVGRTAPDFTLPDLDGEDRTLSALRGEKRAVLVFFRGAW